MSIKNVNYVKDLLSVRYPEIRFSVTNKGACIVIGITASPYVWDSMYDVLDKEASSSGRSYKSAKKEMLKYWGKNRVSVVSVTPDVGFDFDSNLIRKLSISLILSDPSEYEGGEFQIMHMGDKKMTTMKPPMGTAIIFSSTTRHRVRPIKSGKRISLVGWYGGPPFR